MMNKTSVNKTPFKILQFIYNFRGILIIKKWEAKDSSHKFQFQQKIINKRS